MVRPKKGIRGIFSKKIIEVVVSFDDAAYLKKPVYMSKTAPRMERASIESFAEKISAAQSAGGGNEQVLGDQIAEIKTMMQQFSDRMGLYGKMAEPSFPPEIGLLHDQLIAQDFEAQLARQICLDTQKIASKMEANPKDVMRSILTDMLRMPQFIRCTKFRQKVVMLAGPTGVGKTTTLVKLASSMICKEKLSVGIINTDVYRVGAQEHLKAYSEILKTPYLTIYHPEEIGDALDSMEKMDIVLIDTAGKVSGDKNHKKELISLMESGKVDEVYLTVSASTSANVLRTIFSDYGFLKNYNLIVTKMDEVSGSGILFYIADTSRRPLSYVTAGQNVPDDIAKMDPDQVIRRVMGR
jgi:flagellar biosynthesis protein FlhF